MSDRADIEAILSRYEAAIAARDADAIVADYVDGAVGYDLAPPLRTDTNLATDAAGLREWFATWEDDLRVTHAPPEILQDGDLGVLWALQKMSGTKKDGEFSEMWFRATTVVRRIEGAWKIVHIHTSVPMAMDGSGKALSDLTPNDTE